MTTNTGERCVWDVEELDPHDLGRFGGKGAGLARMVQAGIPVPPAFVIGTDVFRAYEADGQRLPAELDGELDEAMRRLEARTTQRFAAAGDPVVPLLVSVRSGAPVSMPGMMDTVLNLGLDAAGALSFASGGNGAPFALDTWLRFWRLFAEIVLGVDALDLERDFEGALASVRAAALERPGRATFEAVERALVAMLQQHGVAAELSPHAQLRLAIAAVFRSWNSRRARAYRKNFGIADTLGTAVTIQAMVFGNRDVESGAGVAFTRNPNTGERGLFGEYIAGRQGEELVSGTATPVDISGPGALRDDVREALLEHGRTLEGLYRDAVDIEFTVESGRLYLLQVRAAKRTAEAAVRIAAELLEVGRISPAEAVDRVTPEQLAKLLRPTFDPAALHAARLLVRGIGSSPGHAAGIAVLDADDAAERAAGGTRVILLRPTTSPQDIRGMLVAEGIVTARGGALSHAAVVSRALDKPCIVGCDALEVDVQNRSFSVAGEVFAEGTTLSIDGETGNVYHADVPVQQSVGAGGRLAHLIAAADELSHARVGVAAQSFNDVARASSAGTSDIVVGLTDLLIAAGTIDRLTDAIGALATAAGPSAQLSIEALARDVAARALEVAGTAPVTFRLPSFLSERARAIVPDWAALPARSLLPLGEKNFYLAIARGVAAAAAGNPAVSLLLSGVSEWDEVRAFRRDLANVHLPVVGAVLRSFASLHNFSLPGEGEAVPVWIDVDSIVRSAYGFPSELVAARGVFAEYKQGGNVKIDPQQTLAPFLKASFDALLLQVKAQHAGVLCSPVLEGAIITSLYGAGYRRFAVPAGAREQTSLRLARAAVGHA